MNRRLLHIVDSLEAGHMQQQLLLLGRGLSGKPYDLHLCAFAGGPLAEPLREAGFQLHVLRRRLSIDPWTLVCLKRHIERLRPDVVHCWQPAANIHGAIAARYAGVRRVVAVVRNMEAATTAGERLLQRRLARRTTCFVVPGPEVRDYFVAQGLQSARFEIIADGVEPVPASAETREALLEELRLPPQTRFIAAWAPLEAGSRLKDLVWALDILQWIYPQVHLLLLGDGPQRRALARFIDCGEVPDCVHLLGNRHDAPRIVAAADFFWHAAVRDGAASSLLQAMACGVPSVAADTPLHRRIIEHGTTGFLADPDDRPSFSRWTHRMLEDAALRERVAAAGRASVLERFPVEQMLQRYEQIYGSLLS